MNEYKLEVRINIHPAESYSGGLQISEEVTLKAADFMEMCKILAQFHDLSEHLKTRHSR